MADKNKRTLYNVSDVISGGGSTGGTRAKFKSGYKGPKKAPGDSLNRAMATAPGVAGNGPAPVVHRSGGILDYAWIAYCAVLAIALATAILAYTTGGSGKTIYYPNNVFTISGVVKDIFTDYKNGGLGSGFSKRSSNTPAQAAAANTQDAGTAAIAHAVDAADGLRDNLLPPLPGCILDQNAPHDFGPFFVPFFCCF